MTLETPKEKQIYGFAMVDCQRAQKLILAPASTPKGKSFLPWLVVFRHPSEKYEFVSWDDDIPN